jgi:hypothetical protein
MIEKSELATQIVQAAQEAFGGGKFGEIRGTGRKPTTAAIKQTFHDLGIKLGYRTAWSGSGTDAEWKYDLVWYEEDKDGYTIRLPLILESELQLTKDTVDQDYVKLVAGRADVRVWLSCAANASDAHERIRKCETQARRFAGSLPGDTYVFIIFEWATRDVIVETRVI